MEHHEPYELLDEKTRNISRAINTIKEELEAVDWYNQRVAATKDESLKAIMAHNRDEEIEHACMALEWLRRNMDGWDKELRTYIFTQGSVIEAEEHGGTSKDDPVSGNTNSLGIGHLK